MNIHHKTQPVKLTQLAVEKSSRRTRADDRRLTRIITIYNEGWLTVVMNRDNLATRRRLYIQFNWAHHEIQGPYFAVDTVQ